MAKYIVTIYPYRDGVALRYATIEADNRVVVNNAVIGATTSFEVDASQYIKVWVSSIEGMERYVEIYDAFGSKVVEGEVNRNKPFVYTIPSSTITTTATTTTTQTYTWTQEFKMRAETGGGWSPFVLERELVVSLKSYFEDRTISIDKAVLSFTLKEAGLVIPMSRTVRIYCNNIKVYDKEVAVQPSGFSDSVEIPVNYLQAVNQFRVEYDVSPHILPAYLQGLSFEGTLQVTFSKILTQEELQNPSLVQQKINEYAKQSAKETVEAQGNKVESVDVQGNTVTITYKTPQGEQKTDWWGTFTGFLQQLPNILIVILFLFIVIELIRVFRH
jgi:hypothetical protein